MSSLAAKIAWLHFKARLPQDWEPVAFSSNPQEGRLEFANRHGHLGRLAWMRCKRPPDLRKMMEEFQKSCLKLSDKEALKSFSGLSYKAVGAFSAGIHREGSPYQAAWHLPAEKTLTIWTFPSYGQERFEKAEAPILESFRENLGEWREWALWGLDFRLPASFHIEKVQAYPANVSIVFECPSKRRFSIHRWGLPELLLDGKPLTEFHRRVLRASRFEVKELSACQLKGFEASDAAVSRRGELDMDYLYGRAWQGRSLCWLDREGMRINSYALACSRKAAQLETADVLPQFA